MFNKLHQQLTAKGRQRFKIFLGLVIFSITTCILYLIFSSTIYFDTRILLAILVPAPLYGYTLYTSLHSKIKNKIFSNIGFEKVAAEGIMDSYDISERGKLATNEVRSGSVDGQSFKMIHFSVTVGSGKNKYTYHFIGVEFETRQSHFSVQIYDKKNYLKPFFGKVKLESNDFHRTFNVYSKEIEHSYYQLDPDTMHDLMELRKEFGFAINVESYQNRILIYVNESVMENMFKKILTFPDILNGEVSDDKLEQYHSSILSFIKRLLKIFASLDYKLKV
jgi:hypothetical protein